MMSFFPGLGWTGSTLLHIYICYGTFLLCSLYQKDSLLPFSGFYIYQSNEMLKNMLNESEDHLRKNCSSIYPSV